MSTTDTQQGYRGWAWIATTLGLLGADTIFGWGLGAAVILPAAVIAIPAIYFVVSFATSIWARVRIAESETYGERVEREAMTNIANAFEEAHDA